MKKTSDKPKRQSTTVAIHSQYRDKHFNQQIKQTMLYKIDKKDRICEPLKEEWTKEEDNEYMQVQPNSPPNLFG